MSIIKSGNPAMQEKSFEGTIFEGIADHGEVMTVKGTLNRFGSLFVLMMATTIFTWSQFYKGVDVFPMIVTGVVGTLIVGLVINFKKTWSPILAPVFALLEGLFVGSISAYFDFTFRESYPGLIMQAVSLTLIVTLVMFLLYRYKVIKVTEKFRSVITIATASIFVFYLIKWVYFLITGSTFAAFTNAATPLGIGFSVVVVVLAALNLLLNFDTIEKGVELRAKKFMEWYCAFGLLVTIVWLYLEILRLLSKLRD